MHLEHYNFASPATPTVPQGRALIATPRAPRKAKHPVKAARLDRLGLNTAIFRFQMVQTDCGTPRLQIETRTYGMKAKRRLWEQDDEESQSGSSSDGPSPVKRRRLRDGAARSLGDGTDAEEVVEELVAASMQNGCTPPSAGGAGSVSCATPSPVEGIKGSSSSSKASRSKTCASCKTKKTPLWRDAEDGTPYCNACGIRYKKYRIRCSLCCYIPRKDEKIGNCCCLCGGRLVHFKLGR